MNMTKVNVDKPWWTSKTLWTNVLVIVIAILTQVESMISAGQAVTLIAVVNIALRVITKNGINFNTK